MHEDNYQQLSHLFVDFCSSQKKILRFCHFLEQLYHNSGETKIKFLRQIHLFTATFRVQLYPFSSRSVFSLNPQKSTSLSM